MTLPTLADALNKAPNPDPKEMPMALPVSHVLDARAFTQIANSSGLEPRSCKRYGEDLVYLFYGGVFYQHSFEVSDQAGMLPVAFLFSPTMLDCVERYFPFDTGGLIEGLYENSGDRLQPFKSRFVVQGRSVDVPRKLVFHLFVTNDAYLTGQPNSGLTAMMDPCPLLYEFLCTRPPKADQRWRRIEAQVTEAVSIHHLLWVGFPSGFESDFAKLYARLEPVVPEYYRYPSFPPRRPGEVAYLLQAEAHKVVSRFLSLP